MQDLDLDAADHNVGKKTRHFYCCLAGRGVALFFFSAKVD